MQTEERLEKIMACSKPALSSSINTFTLDVYNNIADNYPTDNAFMSTTSIMVGLTMLHVGARKNTEKQIAKVLKLGNMNRENLLEEVEKFVSVLKEGDCAVTLQTANKLFPHVRNTISNEYIKIVSQSYKTEVKGMDYTTKSEESRVEINAWVEKETNGKIKDLLPSGSINDMTAMVLVNAIYFKGDWEEQFDPKNTRDEDFFANGKDKIKVQMMGNKFKNTKYTKSEQFDCQVLGLPYAGGNLGMVFLLPNKKTGLHELEKRLSTDALQNLMGKMYEKEVTVHIPKFKLETSYKMKDILIALGMKDLFDEKNADLSDIGKKLYVSQMFHKAFVDVNEEGTQAAAATWVSYTALTCYIPPTIFRAEHPFMFLIWDHRLGVPLFIGRLTNPTA